MPIPRKYPLHRRAWAWLTWATAEQAAIDSPWAMGWRLIFRPDLWRRVYQQCPIILVALLVFVCAVLALALALPAGAAEPKRIGEYTFPVDDNGDVVLDGHVVAPGHVAPATRDQGAGGVCVRVCSTEGIGKPLPGQPAWRLYCLET